MTTTAWHVDPQAVMQIKSLALRAKTIVEGFMSGLHRSPVHGFSVEFSEYRPYVLGDDPRTIDWKLLARTDRTYVKKYEDETNRRCYLAIDQSRSMNYGSLSYTKAEYARTLAATITYFFNMQRDAVGLMACGDDEPQFIPPRRRTGHVQAIMQMLSSESEGVTSHLGNSLESLAALSKRRGLVVIISDMLLDPETLIQPFGYLLGRGHELHLMRLLDPAELSFELDESSMLRDAETGREIFVDPVQAKAEYQQRFEEHEKRLLDICHSRKVKVSTISTSHPLDRVLMEWLRDGCPKTAQEALALTERT